jgi:hypothetical protein
MRRTRQKVRMRTWEKDETESKDENQRKGWDKSENESEWERFWKRMEIKWKRLEREIMKITNEKGDKKVKIKICNEKVSKEVRIRPRQVTQEGRESMKG